MEETKKWYESKTIIASLVSVAIAISVAFGWLPVATTAEEVVITDNIFGLVGVISALIAVYGRIKAAKKIE